MAKKKKKERKYEASFIFIIQGGNGPPYRIQSKTKPQRKSKFRISASLVTVQ